MTAGGTTMRVGLAGQGPPLLLLNGLGGHLDMWLPVLAQLPGRQLVMLDMPGTGGSPALPRRVRMAGYVTLVGAVLDRLGLARADVLGYSWGGALALELAHREPHRVGALVLAATTPGLGGQPPAPWVLAMMATPARYYSRSYLRVVAPFVFGSAPAAADGELAEARLRRPPSVRGYGQQLWAISGWSSRSYLRTLRPRTLVLGGTRDPLVPPRNGRILAREIPGAQLAMVEGGHLFLLERAEQACRVVRRFLDAAPGQSGTRSRT